MYLLYPLVRSLILLGPSSGVLWCVCVCVCVCACTINTYQHVYLKPTALGVLHQECYIVLSESDMFA